MNEKAHPSLHHLHHQPPKQTNNDNSIVGWKQNKAAFILEAPPSPSHTAARSQVYPGLTPRAQGTLTVLDSARDSNNSNNLSEWLLLRTAQYLLICPLKQYLWHWYPMTTQASAPLHSSALTLCFVMQVQRRGEGQLGGHGVTPPHVTGRQCVWHCIAS